MNDDNGVSQQDGQADVAIILRLKRNKHAIRECLNTLPTATPKLNDAYNSLYWEEGMLDALLDIVSRKAN